MSATITVRVGAPAHGGHCIARHEGRAVFVRHALPGELVEAVVADASENARFWTADAVKVIEPSPDRVEHPWADAANRGVGGAELGHVSLEGQRAWKLAVVREAFERFGHVEFTGAVNAAPGEDERGGLGYRTRVSAVVGPNGKAAMSVAGTRELRSLTAMPLAVRQAEAVLLGTQGKPGTRIEVVSTSTGEVTVNASDKVKLTEKVRWDDEDLSFRVSPSDFWQVHVEAPALLVREVVARVGKAAKVVDLYSGVGLLAMPFASEGREVIAIESAGPAEGKLSSLEVNLRPFTLAKAVRGDVRRSLDAMEEGALKGGVMVLDPPRTGAKEKTIEAMVRVEPDRIVYVACDPVALARDIALLAGLGYSLVEADAFDLFPMTHHVETIASFERR